MLDVVHQQEGTFAIQPAVGNTAIPTEFAIVKKVDGASSGLDADLLDGISSAAFGLVASPT
jgi:hypothetical protein